MTELDRNAVIEMKEYRGYEIEMRDGGVYIMHTDPHDRSFRETYDIVESFDEAYKALDAYYATREAA